MTLTVGLLGCYLSGSYEGALVAAACRATARHGGHFVGIRTLGLLGDDSLSASTEDLGQLLRSQVDGWVAQCSAASAGYLRELQAIGKPVVMVGNDDPGISCPKVMSDNTSGVTEAVEHLLGHGHRRIAFVGWLSHYDIRERLRAYQLTLAAHGIEPNPDLVFDADNNFEHGALGCADQIISRGLPCTAIVAGTDLNAVGLVGALNAAGYAVPDDVAVVGFDDKPDAALLSPSLTTVSQRPARLGETGVELLVRMLHGERVEDGRHLVPTSLVVRESCGCQAPVRAEGPAIASGQVATADYYSLRKALRSETQVALALLRSADASSLDWLGLTGAHTAVLALEDPSCSGQENTVFDRMKVIAHFPPSQSDVGSDAPEGVPGSLFPPASMLEQVPPGHCACVFPFKGRSVPRGVLVTVQELGPEIEDESLFMWSHIFSELMEHQAVLADLKAKSDELASAYAMLHDRALHDDLTGLVNRRCFRESLSEAMATSTGEPGHAYAVLWIDVDNFKSLNDTLGHAAGDAVLVEVAKRLRENIRAVDVAGRIGGDEFVLLADASSSHNLDTLVERLARSLNSPYLVEGQLLPVTVSIGLALGGSQHFSPDDILRDADMAMYQAKLTHSGAVVRSGQ